MMENNDFKKIIEEQLGAIKVDIDKISIEIRKLSEQKASIDGSINQAVTNLVSLQGKQAGFQELAEKIKDA